MSELKHIRVREAKPRDIGLFRKLWLKLLDGRAKQGSIIQPTEQSMGLYEQLFKTYTEKHLEGIVLFVADQGVLMLGANSPLLEYNGKTAINWGVFANGNADIKKALIDHADAWALEKEFVGILIEQFGNSQLLDGFKEIGVFAYKKLNRG